MRVKELVPLFVISLILLPLTVIGEAGTTLVVPPWNHCLGLHKVRQFHLDVYSGYREKFDDPQGLFCMKLAVKDDPATSRDDDELNVFGLNSGRHTLIYNKNLTSIGIVGGPGAGERQFSRPRSLTGDREGNIFVADTGNDRIVHLRYEDDDLVAVAVIAGAGESRFREPEGVALSGGLLYVADSGNDRIVVLDPDGRTVEVLKPRIEAMRLRRPRSIAVVSKGDRWLYYRDFFIAVVDSLGRRIWKIDMHGRTLRVVSHAELGRAVRFNHIAVDYYGNIYATDTEGGVIHKFDRHLNYIVAIGDGEGGGAQFDEPRGIAIHRRFGQVFVSERSGAQYFWIGADILRLSLDELTLDVGRGTVSAAVSFLLTEHATVSLRLEDEHGRDRGTLLDEHLLPCGRFERRIEIPHQEIGSLAKCTLRLAAAVTPTYSSGAFLTVRRASASLAPSLLPASSQNYRK